MGNCQAIDAVTLVIQHPCGKIDKFYWPLRASEIMRMNPGHYVALLISTSLCQTNNNNNDEEECPNDSNNNGSNGNSVRLTKIKLFRPADTLVLGQVDRLITTQDVMKGLSAKKHAKMNRNRPQSEDKPGKVNEKPRRSELEKDTKVMKDDRHRPRTTSSANSAARSRMWQPSLQSISESGS